MEIHDEWIDDLPQQFQGKKNIEILIKAFSRQMEDVKKAFKQLDTDTNLDNAVGKNLDMVGDIETLSRKKACYILRSAEKELTDDIYRSVLQYKAIQNNTDCTYYEIMDAMSLLWNTENVTYQEDPDRPATIIMRLPTTNMDAIDPSVGRILSIKPSGVGIVYIVGFWAIAYFGAFEKFINPVLIMKWRQPFYSFALAGAKTLDGTWPLDGSVLLDSKLISMPISIVYSGISAVTDEEVFAGLVLAYQNEIKYSPAFGQMRIAFKIYEAGRKIRVLDGTWPLDGNVTLSAEYWSVPLRVVNGSYFAKSIERIKEAVSVLASVKSGSNSKGGVISVYKAGNKAISGASICIRGQTAYNENIGTQLISRRNMWYLDGSYPLDGSRYLNATEIKEEI